MTVRVRIAPSPTGEPHVGTAYQALFDVAFARQNGGQFIIRIEDTDQARFVEGSEQRILDTLAWLGLDWQEGPDKGGPFGPYRQSERLPIYQKYVKQLLEGGHAYYCWCSQDRLAEMRTAQQKNKLPTGYDRFCVGKTQAQRSSEPGYSERPVVRMLIPDDVALNFPELIRGTSNSPRPDDQVILKADGFPTYHLAVVVDDHEMQITHVVRGEEWISSTPKHLLLYKWLGWEPPLFAHTPDLRNTDRSKISKRKNPAARLLWFKEQGYLPEALLNFLALLGWSMPDGREIFTLEEMVKVFSWDRFSTVGPIFDMDKLDWMNGQYLQNLSDEEFLERAKEFLPEGAEDQMPALRRLAVPLKERTKKLSDLAEQVDFLFTGDLEVDTDLILKQGLDIDTARQAIVVAEEIVRHAESFEPDPLEAVFNAACETNGWNRRRFFMTIRVVATGKTATPPLFDTLAAIGRERTLSRLKDAADKLRSL